MKSRFLVTQARTFVSIFLIAGLTLLLAACGGSGSSSSDDSDNTDPETVELQLRVLSHQGARLADASVAVGGTTGTTDSNGALSVEVDEAEEVVATASLSGYITQAVRLAAETDSQAQIRLMPVADAFEVSDIQASRTLATRQLGGRLTLPASAFVTPAGAQASGPATIEVTPWDISSDDLAAMPGDSQALDAAGERTALISAGMMTVQVQDNAGEPLQLAQGAEATLQLDLPVDSINGQALTVGDSIPMWHFDEAQGLWLEDTGVQGTVVASATSPVGLAVSADVPHFSTWNWDFKFEEAGSVDVECQLQADQSSVPCSLLATITLADGSVASRSTQLPSGGSTIVNMPSDATIDWQGTGASGLIGEATSTLTGGTGADVVIALQAPTTDHDVQCLMPDSSSVPCNVTLTDGTSSHSQDIPAQGGNIVTLWSGISQGTTVNWQGETLGPVQYNGQTFTGAGTATSGPSGQVSISLVLTPVDDVAVNCVSSVNTPLPCTVSAFATVQGAADVTEVATIEAGGGTLTLPTATTLIEWQADSDGAFAQNGQFIVFSGTATTALLPAITLVLDVENVQGPAAQTLQVRCVNSGGTAAATCDITALREGGAVAVQFEEFIGVAEGAYQMLNLPNGIAEDNFLLFNAAGDDGSQGGESELYNTLTEGQQINIQLN